MNTEQYLEKLSELRRNYENPTYRRGNRDWIDLLTGEPRGESRDANNLHCVQLRARKDFVIGYINQFAILSKGSVIEKYSEGTYGSTFALVSGEMWTKRKGDTSEPYLVKPWRMDYREDGRINHGRVYTSKSSTGYRNANWFIFSFSPCGTNNSYPGDYGLFHKSMWDLQYIKTVIRNEKSRGEDGYIEYIREWGTRVYSNVLHPDQKEELGM